ncbi:DUF5007 domain-containing protein [Niabella sp. CC-SYL272]|uniref:DUF5007 domain-containing protein n=1 Tax=Niabella agricola TaxID=2891571 RepID=UPI001F1E3EDA|nr:DUF5007 domain-containing protein [Niabella agricola]MCF3110400.1 DUF5007 domain-containing protein [Niabella agricola]
MKFPRFTCWFLFAAGAISLLSCKRLIPQERENIGPESDINQAVFSPTLGRTTTYEDIFSKQSTTYPATFKILNFRRRSGDAARELETVVPVTVWKQAYTGKETSLQEIENKRTKENHQLFEIGEHSGDLTLWAEASSRLFRSQPDSGYLFDLEVSNSGGRRYFQALRLMPMKEIPFEPTNIDQLTGMPTRAYVFPSTVNMKGDSTGRTLSASDVRVYIRKVDDGGKNEHKLTIRFLDKQDRFINPDRFSNTNWAGLLHGFNMVKNATGVTYDVAYPIPLARLRTLYTTSSGEMATLRFSYFRTVVGGETRENYLGLDFRIFEPGNWEIVFKFVNDNPRFTND